MVDYDLTAAKAQNSDSTSSVASGDASSTLSTTKCNVHKHTLTRGSPNLTSTSVSLHHTSASRTCSYTSASSARNHIPNIYRGHASASGPGNHTSTNSARIHSASGLCSRNVAVGSCSHSSSTKFTNQVSGIGSSNHNPAIDSLSLTPGKGLHSQTPASRPHSQTRVGRSSNETPASGTRLTSTRRPLRQSSANGSHSQIPASTPRRQTSSIGPPSKISTRGLRRQTPVICPQSQTPVIGRRHISTKVTCSQIKVSDPCKQVSTSRPRSYTKARNCPTLGQTKVSDLRIPISSSNSCRQFSNNGFHSGPRSQSKDKYPSSQSKANYGRSQHEAYNSQIATSGSQSLSHDTSTAGPPNHLLLTNSRQKQTQVHIPRRHINKKSTGPLNKQPRPIWRY
ncbi:hypothetical protein Pcinc_018402 [Petrolisthes cinctipes]|uniref:Uncharacterized protein n=1 Tax=Petrolisthes cinctipes TaxID=88211 RepID=A0AAE1FS51_PETCI|nr:hypothetical protein Pcinc_018402 [Petrolisthes cinctipes]